MKNYRTRTVQKNSKSNEERNTYINNIHNTNTLVLRTSVGLSPPTPCVEEWKTVRIPASHGNETDPSSHPNSISESSTVGHICIDCAWDKSMNIRSSIPFASFCRSSKSYTDHRNVSTVVNALVSLSWKQNWKFPNPLWGFFLTVCRLILAVGSDWTKKEKKREINCVCQKN